MIRPPFAPGRSMEKSGLYFIPLRCNFTKIKGDKIVFSVLYDDSTRDKGVGVERRWYDICAENLEKQNIDPEIQYVDKELFNGFSDTNG